MFSCDTCDATTSAKPKDAEAQGWMFYTRATFFCPQCAFRRRNPGMEDFAPIATELHGRIQEFVGLRIDQTTVRQMTCVIHNVFDAAVARRAVLVAAEGLQVIGAMVDDDLRPGAKRTAILVQWQTKFQGPFGVPFGEVRWPNEMPEEYMALGRYKQYDLYYVPQKGLPPTVVARYGPESDYLTYNPTLQDIGQMALAGEHFAVALQRLLFIRPDFQYWIIEEEVRRREEEENNAQQ